MKRFVAVAVTLLAVALSSFAGRTAEPKNLSAFMRLKLAYSQKLLEGLALEDYDVIAKNAQDLSALSQDERWEIYQTPEYLQHSIEFRSAADALKDAAKESNLDGAALGYVSMTLKCVSCHKHIRDVRMASLPAPSFDRLGAK